MPDDLDARFERLAARAADYRRRAMTEPRAWPPPAYTVETWEAHGLRCAVARGYSLCGYVHVPEGHPAADKWHGDLNVRVHGGLTFRCVAAEGGAWFGFDTGHAWDWVGAPPGADPSLEMPGRVWTVPDVREEAESLARQLAAMVAPAGGVAEGAKRCP